MKPQLPAPTAFHTDKLSAFLKSPTGVVILLLIVGALVVTLYIRNIVMYRVNNPSFRSADDLDTLAEHEGEPPAKL